MQNELFETAIPRLVVRKAIPMLFGIFAILLFTVVDTWFISLLGTEPLAAISFAFPVTFVIMSLAMGMGIGLGANMGRLLGAGKHSLAARFTTDSLILATIMVLLLSALGMLIHDPLFRLLGAEEHILEMIRQYMHIWLLGIPLLVLPMVGNSAIRATGDISTPTKVMLVAGLTNGILDPILIFGLDMGLRGAALATALSWLITFVVGWRMLRFKLKLLVYTKPVPAIMLKNWAQLLKIGLPASLSQMLNPLVNGMVIAIIASFGIAGVATMGIGARVDAVLLTIAGAVSSVMPTILGQNYGRQLYQRAAQTVRFAILLILGVYTLMYGLVFVLAEPLARIFSDDPEVIATTVRYLTLIPLGYAWLGTSNLITQVLNVLHKPMLSLGINMVRLLGLLVPFAWLGGQWSQTEGVFIGITAAYVGSGIAVVIYGWWLAGQIEKTEPVAAEA